MVPLGRSGRPFERRTVRSARPAAEDGCDVPAFRGWHDGKVPPVHPMGLDTQVGP